MIYGTLPSMYGRLFQLQEETLKTLANQKRLEIVQLLQNRELTVTEMVEMLGMPQANISQHLGLLRQVRIVNTRKDGLHVYYRLSDERIIAVIRELRAFLKSQFTHEPEIAHLGSLDSSIYPIVRDPVCGMRLSVSEAFAHLDHGGHSYYFCATGCKERFETHPGYYVPHEKAITR